jgi:enoyl-CoA hydratase/carnithine racemase
LPLSVGVNRAKDVILGGRVLDAATAMAWGVVSRISPDAKAEAARWGGELASKDSTAMSLAKGLLNSDVEQSLSQEREAEAILYGNRNNS